MTSTALYRLERLSRGFIEAGQPVQALDGLTLEIPASRFVAICGPSGAGKSTLLHVLGLLDRDYRGSLSLLGEDLGKISSRAVTRYRLEHIGFVFQRHFLVDAMTVLENVAWPHWRLHGDRRSAFARARDLLEELGLAERTGHRPLHLSGGELQRVALARALVNAPRVLLADEPTAQLDEPNAMHIIRLLSSLCSKGHSVLTVTHDPLLTAAADVVLRMRYGRLLASKEANDA
jgi:putative ABC transport system ATP-binding protein